MKKCLIVCLVVLFFSVSTAYSQKIELGFVHESNGSQKMKLKGNTRIPLEIYYDYFMDRDVSKEIKMINPGISENSSRFYMQAVYSPFSWFKIRGIAGIARREISTNVFEIAEITSYYRYESWTKRESDPLDGKGEFNPLYGGSIEFTVQLDNTLTIGLESRYLYQLESPLYQPGTLDLITLFEDAYENDYVIYDWYTDEELGTIEIEREEYTKLGRIGSQELEIRLSATKRADEFTFIAGGTLLLAETIYKGTSFTRYYYANSVYPERDEFREQESEFKLKAINQQWFGIFTRINYRPVKSVGFFLELRVFNRPGVSAGISFFPIN